MGRIGPILLTGATGMLGSALTELCRRIGEDYVSYGKEDLDVTDAQAVRAAVNRFKASGGHLVINAAAYTDVERAEEDEGRAFAVNDTAAHELAVVTWQNGLALVHVSTDFVFDGAKGAPYGEEDEVRPLNVYGRSKLAGERAVLRAHPEALVIRTSWVYGPGGENFATRIIALARSRDAVEVVDDEVGSPTAAGDLSAGIILLCRHRAKGLYHLAGSGFCSRYEMAEEIVRVAGLRTRLEPVSSAAFPTKAIRPRYCSLSIEKARALGVDMPPWRESLYSYVTTYLAEAV